MDTNLTWQEAKEETQRTAHEIASTTPEAMLESIAQNPTGVLLSCARGQHKWHGWTRATLRPGSDAEAVTKHVEEHFANSRFTVKPSRGSTDLYAVQLIGENDSYIFGQEQGKPLTIIIDAHSSCFTLPEGIYPGGDF